MNLQRRDFVKCLGGAAALGASSALAAGTGCCEPRQDDLWFINTCGVPCGRLSEDHARCFAADRLTPQKTWQRSSLQDFFAASADGRPTVFWVHGHRVNYHWAMESGWWIYNGLVQCCPTSPPIRYVILKWPSEGGGRPIPDAREKAGIADHTCYKLAWLLGHIPSQTPLSFVGFSYGARVIGGAMQLTAGGKYCGYTLDRRYESRSRVVYWAGAANYDSLAPGHANGYAINAIDRMLNLYNCNDPVLRFHPRVTGADAMGMVGMPASWLGADAFRFKQRNVNGEVNRLHLTRNYALNGSIMASTRPYLLWNAV